MVQPGPPQGSSQGHPPRGRGRRAPRRRDLTQPILVTVSPGGIVKWGGTVRRDGTAQGNSSPAPAGRDSRPRHSPRRFCTIRSDPNAETRKGHCHLALLSLGHLRTHGGAQTHDPEIQSRTPHLYDYQNRGGGARSPPPTAGTAEPLPWHSSLLLYSRHRPGRLPYTSGFRRGGLTM